MLRRTAVALGLLLALGAVASGQELTDKNYEEIRRQIMPTAAEEEWRKIEWHPTLWDGVIKAQKDDKPIMFFAMNGHPFGCT
ncbi:MAG: hypothetical protein HS108_11480 [Planctomycetes bacterium]|jgi:hypothetical protein|nr:hypothetical protein [Planctomycetota bacterium]MCL4730034.1 hypothetical protein [Planctomycetota bacterium]